MPSFEDAFPQRLRIAAAATGNRPGLAATLAQSDLEDGQVQMVGAFAQGLDTAMLTRLARQSGARTNLSPTEQSQMDALGEQYDDVQPANEDGERNWLERTFDWGATLLSNTGEALTSNPVTGSILDVFEGALDVVKTPARILSDVVDQGNDDEIDDAMRAQGYDPQSAGSYLAFMFNQGESLYHDLDGARQTYGDDIVDLITEQQRDPEGFAERLTQLDPAKYELTQTKEYAEAYEVIDRQHISPGRDIARTILLGNTDSGAFTALSGTLDAAYTLLLDPTLMLGRAARGVRALDAAGTAVNPGRLANLRPSTGLTKVMDAATGGRYRAGLKDAMDQDGLRNLLAIDESGNAVTEVGKGAQRFLEDAKKLRGATDDAERASLYAGMQARHRALMPFLDEVNGTRVIGAKDKAASYDRNLTDVNGVQHAATAGKAIESLGEFTDYMVGTAGLLRMGGGFAAKREVYLPTRIAIRTELSARRAEARAAKGVQKNEDRWVLDHSKPHTILPDESEEAMQEMLADAADRGDAVWNLLHRGANDGTTDVGAATPLAKGNLVAAARKSRARFEQRARRVSSLMPTVSSIDLTSSAGTEQVRNFARLYMNKAEADRLASLYAGGNLGQRRQVLNGIIEQTFHASGLSRSAGGAREIEKFRADQLDLDRRAYGIDGTDVIKTEAGDRHVALHPSQLSSEVMIPDFRSLQYAATKHAAGGWMARKTGAIRAGFFGDALDNLMGVVKLGWITSAAGGTRNAIDEAAGAALVGLGPDALAGRALFSQATKDSRKASRAERLAAAKVEARFGPRIPLAFRGAADTVNDVFMAAGLSKLLSFTRTGDLSEEALRYTRELADDIKDGLVRETITGSFFADDVARTLGNDGALELHRNGLMASQVRFNGDNVKSEFGGYKQVEVDGGQGLDAWVSNLGQKFGSPTDPARVVLQSMVDGGDVVEDTLAYMRSDAMRVFREQAEITNTTKRGTRAETDAEREEALQGYVERLIADVTKTVTGRGKPFHDETLVDDVRAWKSETTSAAARARAEKFEGEQGRYDADAAEADLTGAELKAQRDDLVARHRGHRDNDKATARVEQLTTTVTKVEADLERARGHADYSPDEADQAAAMQQWETAEKEVTRLEQRVAARVEARRHAKAAPSTRPETLTGLQEKVTAARADLAKARKWSSYAEGKLDRALGRVTEADAAAIPRLEAKLAALRVKLEEASTSVRDDLGERPTDEMVADARATANKAHQRGHKARNVGESNKRAGARARAKEAAGFTGHVDDKDIAQYLREKGLFAQGDVDGGKWADGRINMPLAEKLLAGEVPDRSWLKENVPEADRPVHAIGKVFLPVNPRHAAGKVAEGYTSMLTKAYGKVVTDQVNALSRNPMLTAAYVQARKHTAAYEADLVEAGWTKEAAEAVTRKMARTHAEQLVIKSIDNPQVATQFSILARNFWAFERAQEDWLRRWGRIIRDDPTVIRKVQLGIHGAETAGIVEKDDEGNLIFTYPGSGMVINAFTKVGAALGINSMVNVPMVPDLTSQLTFLNPSLDNPIGFSGTPVVSIPFKTMAATLGADYPLLSASMDKVINGDLGAGKEWYETFLPGSVNRIISGVVSEDPGSQFASAYTNALLNLEAAGRLDELDGTDPTAIARFQNDLKSQITNQMFLKSIFAFFAPAAPGQPQNTALDEDGNDVAAPDFAFHKAGLTSLKDEARKVFSSMPYEDALVWWTKNHPGELVYTPGYASRTDVGGDSAAQAPATMAAAKWMQDNRTFLDKFGGKGGVGVYFMPQGEGVDGEYSDVAYRAQLEQGIREYKDLDDLFEEIVVKRGEAIYYDTKDDVDAQIAAATAAGDLAKVDELESWWSEEKELIYQTNPLLAKKNAEFATSGVGQQQTLSQLNALLADPDAQRVLGSQTAGVAQLLLAQRRYEAATEEVKGKRGYAATSSRQEAKSEYEDAVKAVTEQWPGLADLARGAFRVPN